MTRNRDNVIRYFSRRAPKYDVSSHWCHDEALSNLLFDLVRPHGTQDVLDVACGTGLVARTLRPHATSLVGLDITTEMMRRASAHFDHLVLANAEAMPFASDLFHLVICRQGIQFMDASRAAAEMVRVARPGGKVCLINLCAYGAEDRDWYFEILRLRNPVRKNFFLREDLVRLLRNADCRTVELHEHVSIEDIDVWSETAAIEDQARMRIRDLYLQAPLPFRHLHKVEQDETGRIRDHMLVGIVIGTK